MNDLMERFFELPARQRVLILVGAVALLIVAYLYLFYWPRSQEISKLEAKLATLKEERNHKAQLAANLAEARKTLVELQAKLREAEAKLPTKKEIPDLLSSISGAGSESGLEVATFRQRPEKFHDFYAEVPVDMVVRGSYFQVQAFFERVSSLRRIVNVGSIGIKLPQRGVIEDPIRVDTTCKAITFRFLDEAERERIAREKSSKEGKKRPGKGQK